MRKVMNPILKNILLLILVTFTISACSTMNKSECLNADWKTIGFGDGSRGYKASRISQHSSACAEHGVRPDLSAYNAGRDQGLKQYCIPSTGYNKGASGYSYNGVCSGHNEGPFVEALNYGRTVYSAVKTLDKMKSDYANEEQYIYKLERKLKRKENQLISGKLSKLKAYKLLNETKQIAEELGKAKSNLGALDDEISKQAQHVAYLKGQRNYR